MEESKKVGLISCGCGCKELIPDHDRYGRPRRFKAGHFFRMPINIGRKLSDEHKEAIGAGSKGEKHWNYHGGKSKHTGGYIRQLSDTNRRDNRILEHRLVWEDVNKACLLEWGVVHHKNHKRDDNMPKNLQGMMNSKHAILHRTKDMTDRQCLICNSNMTYRDKNGHSIWRRHLITGEKWICQNCHDKLRPFRKRKSVERPSYTANFPLRN